MIHTKIWTAESNIGKELFDENEALQPMDLRYLDIPYVFCPSQDGFNFIDALVECPELEIFGLHSVQILIDSHHFYWKKVNLINNRQIIGTLKFSVASNWLRFRF